MKWKITSFCSFSNYFTNCCHYETTTRPKTSCAQLCRDVSKMFHWKHCAFLFCLGRRRTEHGNPAYSRAQNPVRTSGSQQSRQLCTKYMAKNAYSAVTINRVITAVNDGRTQPRPAHFRLNYKDGDNWPGDIVSVVLYSFGTFKDAHGRFFCNGCRSPDVLT